MASMIGVEHAKNLVQEVADVTAVLSLLDGKTSIYRVLTSRGRGCASSPWGTEEVARWTASSQSARGGLSVRRSNGRTRVAAGV